MQQISVVKQKSFCENSVKTNYFLHFWEISRVPHEKLPRTTGGEPLIYFKEQKVQIVEWWFESKWYATVRRRYAREFNERYVEAPHQKFIQYTVQKFMTKGTALDCRQGKAVRISMQDLLQTLTESVLLYSRVKKNPSGVGAKSSGYQ